MDHLNEHIGFFIDKLKTDLQSLKKGDLAELNYDGEIRYVLVLHPNWEKQMHALALERLDKHMFLRISMMSLESDPRRFYETYLAKQPAIKKVNAYRRFDIQKIRNIQLVIYDMGYNLANPNTIMAKDKSILLGIEKSGEVYAEDYKKLMPLINDRAKKYGVYVPTLNNQEIQRFIRKINNPKFVKSWMIPRTLELESQHEQEQLEKLKELTTLGGVFILPETAITDLKQFGAKVL